MHGSLVLPDGVGRNPAIVWMHSSGAIGFPGDVVPMARAGVISLHVESESGCLQEAPNTPEINRS
jgi:hypothetical protein